MQQSSPNATLREVYREPIGKLLKHLDIAGIVREETSVLMCGFLDGAAIAFRHNGDQEAADLCQRTSRELRNNWRRFLDCVPALHAAL